MVLLHRFHCDFVSSMAVAESHGVGSRDRAVLNHTQEFQA
jgi:hypothetical protein